MLSFLEQQEQLRLQILSQYWYQTGVGRIQKRVRIGRKGQILFLRYSKKESLRVFELDLASNLVTEAKVERNRHDARYWAACQIGGKLYLTGGNVQPKSVFELYRDSQGVFVENQ